MRSVESRLRQLFDPSTDEKVPEFESLLFGRRGQSFALHVDLVLVEFLLRPQGEVLTTAH